MKLIKRKILILFIIFLFLDISFSSVKSININLNNQLAPFINEDPTEEIDENITSIMKDLRIPSISAVIIKNNSVVWFKGYGFYDKFFRKKPAIDTCYLAGSVSKAITATALMQLCEKGLFDLDDDVNKYLPFNLRNPNYPDEPITFRMLLSHQSSLGIESNIKTLIRGNIAYFLKCLDKLLIPGERWFEPSLWTKNHPGQSFNYSNIGFGLLGYLVEIISGESFNKYCEDNIFIPLNMFNSSFKLKDLKRRNIAVPYWEGKLFLRRLPIYSVPISSAGGLITSAEDLSHFLIAHMNQGIYQGVRILNESSIELMHTLYSYTNISGLVDFYYGLGWMIFNESGTEYQGHHGDTYGSHCRMKYRLSDKTGVIFFHNFSPSMTDIEKNKQLIGIYPVIFEELFKLADKIA